MNKKQLTALVDQATQGITSEEDMAEAMKFIRKTFYEKALNAELDDHLGYDKHSTSDSPNARNGHSRKTVYTDDGALDIDTPRDRKGKFEPQLIKKRQTRLSLIDDKILSLYSKGLSTREITETLEELYDTEVSPTLISKVTNAVLEHVVEWQSRPLDDIYPIVYLDCIVVKVRQDRQVINKAIYLALGVNMEGHKELLGLWLSENEGAKFWLSVLTELQNRGVKDILIACVDGLKGFPEAINAVFPDTVVQTCIVHLIRHSLNFCAFKDRRETAKALKAVYRAKNADAALIALDEFEAGQWGKKYPAIVPSWRRNWDLIIPFFAFPEGVRKIIYTTNAIESLNSSFRKISRNRNLFPSSEAVYKLFYLAIKNISKKWTIPIRNWPAALNRFSIEYAYGTSNNN